MRRQRSKSEVKNQALPAHGQKPGELFLIATPIGHLKDITLRALEVLKNVDLIACEDTRTSGVLLAHYGITVPRQSYHAHNEAVGTAALLARLLAGSRIALISDAGTPLISDPGERLVRAAIEAGVRVTPIPGASALLAALSIAGLPALPFYMAGFLPNKSKARQDALRPLTDMPATLVCYESPNRLTALLNDAALILGDRPAAVARELTKIHEECRRDTLSRLRAYYEQHPPRGECVVLIAGAAATPKIQATDVEARLAALLETHGVREAAQIVADETGLPRRALYQRALTLKS